MLHDARPGAGPRAPPRCWGPRAPARATLLRLLNRLADPDSGTVRFGGRDVRELDPLRAAPARRAWCPRLPAPLPGQRGRRTWATAPRCAGARPTCAAALRPGRAGRLLRRPRRRAAVRGRAAARDAGPGAGARSPTCCCWTSPPPRWTSRARDGVEADAVAAGTSWRWLLVTHDRGQAGAAGRARDDRPDARGHRMTPGRRHPRPRLRPRWCWWRWPPAVSRWRRAELEARPRRGRRCARSCS